MKITSLSRIALASLSRIALASLSRIAVASLSRIAVASLSRIAVASLSLVALSAVRSEAATIPTLNSSWNVANGGPWDPPDALGAAGPRGVLLVNNDRVLYSNKAGDPYPGYSSLSLRDFFIPPTPPNILNDPRVLYDPQSERFLVTCSEFSVSGSPADTSLRAYLTLSVSTSSHPRSPADWVKRRFDVTKVVGSGAAEEHYAPDYPQIGVDAYAFHVTGNFFRLPLTGAGANGIGIFSFPKAQLLSGGPVTPLVTYVTSGNPATLQPVSVLWSPPGPTDVSYFVEIPRFASTSLRLWALVDPLGTRTLASTFIPAPEHGLQLDLLAPQVGTDVNIRTWSGVAQGLAQWHAGDIWFVATGDTAESFQSRTRAHWYRLSPNGFPSGSPSLTESGVLDGGPGAWTFLPALGLTPRGDVGIVYQQSSSAITPTMMFAGRGAADAAFAPSVLVKASAESALNRNYPFPCAFCDSKWGDDYAVSVDPADSSLWATCELAQPSQTGTTPLWLHQWANIIFDDRASGWPGAGRRVRQGQTPVAGLTMAADDSGGVYVEWHDQRMTDSAPQMLFAQRVTGTGAQAGGWPANGARVQRAGGNVAERIVPDGSGGFYSFHLTGGVPTTLSVVRLDRRGRTPAGWPAGPVVVVPSASSTTLAAASDGDGGLLGAYVSNGLRVQRVSPLGELVWPSPMQLAPSASQLEVAPEFAGGAFVAWTASGHARVQHLLATGVPDPAWPATGLDLGLSATPKLVPDGSGGVFVVHGGAGDVVARRLQRNGTPAPGWPASVPVCAAAGTQDQPIAAADGAGGLLVAWCDQRDAASERDIYVQRLTGTGALATGWPLNGLRLCGAVGEQTTPAIVADGAGGAVVAWADVRGLADCSSVACGTNVFWSHATFAGLVDAMLPPDGAAAGPAAGIQSVPALVRTGNSSAIVAWLDGRSAPDGDPAPHTQVFAQRLQYDASGPGAGVPPARVTLADALGPPRPNPTRTAVSFEITLVRPNAERTVELGVFDVAGRLVRRLQAPGLSEPGVRALEWDLRDESGQRVRAGRFYLRLQVDARTFTRAVTVR